MPSSLHDALPRLSEAPLHPFGIQYYELRFLALGSQCQLLYKAESLAAAEAYRHAAAQWLSSFEKRFSRFLPGSELSRINSKAGVEWCEIDPQFELLLTLCDHYHFITKGAFDAASLPLTLLWDWKRKREALPSEAEIAAARALIGWSRVQRAPGRIFLPEKGMMLDFGGVGKEFAVDCLMQIGVARGLEQLMVNLGGDIAAHGDSPDGQGWCVGLENPADITQRYCGIRLRSGAAVATSGDYRRCFELGGRRYGHILDCRTGWPVANGTSAATVIAPRCTAAGLYSTAAMALGGRAALGMLESAQNVEGCLWHNGQLHETRGFRSETLPDAWKTELSKT